MAQQHTKSAGKSGKPVGRPKGEETARIMIYLPVDLADAVRAFVESHGMSLTGFYEKLTREALAKEGK